MTIRRPTCAVRTCRRSPAPTSDACTDHVGSAVTLTHLALPGVTYRQLDYWVRAGYLRPTVPTPGTGTARDWSPEEIEIARLMARLTAAGFDLAVAARVAREQVEEPTGTSVLRGDLILLVATDTDQRADATA